MIKRPQPLHGGAENSGTEPQWKRYHEIRQAKNSNEFKEFVLKCWSSYKLNRGMEIIITLSRFI